MNICLFKPEEINQILDSKDERAVHLNRVLHKKTGDTFSAGIIGGQAGTATITKTIEKPNEKTGKIELAYEFTFSPETDGKKLFPLVMIIGFPRPIQLKRLLRDIAALGVCEVHLTGTELGEKSYMQSTLVERGAAYQMLLDGTVQAASTHVPELFLHSTLKECLDSLGDSVIQKYALDNIRPKDSLQNLVNKSLEKENPVLQNSTCKNSGKKITSQSRIAAAIGSERGWTDKERDLLSERGFTLCSMGNRVMRTETAATVSASIILSSLGFLC